jgi:hypothetical protein
LDFAVADDAADAHAAHVVTGNHYLKAAGFDVQEIELFDRSADRAAADLFDNTHTVVGIDDLVADVKIQITVHKKAPGQEKGRGENVVFYWKDDIPKWEEKQGWGGRNMRWGA